MTKPTLYRHFASKDALVAAYLDARREQLETELHDWVEVAAPAQRPRAVVDWLCSWISRAHFNGCAFTRARAELHDDAAVREKARQWRRALLATVEKACRDAGTRRPEALARQLTLIIEGATTMAFISGDSGVATEAARELSDAALTAACLEKP